MIATTIHRDPAYGELFEELRATHPWPQAPNVLGDAMHALARARGAKDETANAYGDKARDWAIATWRDARKEHRPLTITDASGGTWIYAVDRGGQEWAIRGDVYANIHRQEHEREMRATGQRHLTLGRIEELNRAADANPRIMHTAYKGIYPVVWVEDPETGTRRRKVLSRSLSDHLPPWPPESARPTPKAPAPDPAG